MWFLMTLLKKIKLEKIIAKATKGALRNRNAKKNYSIAQKKQLCFYCRIVLLRSATSSSFRGGGQFSWNFIRWRRRTYPTVAQLLRKRSPLIIMYFCPQTRRAVCKHKHPHSAQRWLIKTERFTTALGAESPVSSKISDFTPYTHARRATFYI